MIRRDHPKLSTSLQCKLVKLSRSAFYCAPVGIDEATLTLKKAIDRVFSGYPFFGRRRITASLRREGTIAGRHRVRRLMARMEPGEICRRPRTSQSHELAPVLTGHLGLPKEALG
ncbi:IS3 family transposase [Jhaorihella thermophila]|nr:IS3 family transposase [Jhaorihella thermophila]